MTLAEIYEKYAPGSADFVAAVQTHHCSLQMTATEIQRLALGVAIHLVLAARRLVAGRTQRRSTATNENEF